VQSLITKSPSSEPGPVEVLKEEALAEYASQQHLLSNVLWLKYAEPVQTLGHTFLA
jgi:hypothetical protein